MRYIPLTALFFTLFTACGPSGSPETETVRTEEALPAADPEEMTEEEAIAYAKGVATEITAKAEAGVFKTDSIEYACEDAMLGGTLTLYSDAGGIVLAENSFSMSDHEGQTDRWYFKDGKLVLLHEYHGTWRFGGKMTTDEDGNEYPGTIDDITENYFYFDQGHLFKHLVKEYQIVSGEEEINPDDVPAESMAQNGETPVSYNFIAAVMATRAVDCGLLE